MEKGAPIPRDIAALPTPSLLIDVDRLDANIRDMCNRLAQHGVAFRPHAKTHKCVEIARRMALQPGFCGLTVSTLREAEFFAQAGFRDLLYGVSISPDKFRRAGALLDQCVDLTLVVDTPQVCDGLIAWLSAESRQAKVMIEVDVDGHRAGLAPGDPVLPELAAQLAAAPESAFRGIMVHAGESYFCGGEDAIAEHAERERSGAVAAAEVLRTAGIDVPVVSVGSTPTARYTRDLTGVTEVRPGVFTFYDLVMAGIGACEEDELALSVLSTVISHKASHRRLIIDAGALALSKDRGTMAQARDCGFGLVMASDGGAAYPGLRVNLANQEHGIINLPPEYDLNSFPIGSRLRILPNHACLTAAAHPGYFLLEEGRPTGDYWERCNGW